MFGVKVLSSIGVTIGLVLLTTIVYEISKSNAVTFPSTKKLSLLESSNSIDESKRKLEEQQFTAQKQRKIALVIGNGAYSEDPLSNPVNDASDVAQALREIGFEVTLLKDAERRAMDEAVETFSRQLRQGEIGVFYYAGHGVQVAGENYLIPLDAKLNREKDVSYEAIPLGKVLNAIEDTDAQVKIIILDACRDNPFYRRWRSSGRSLATRGLAGMDSTAKGTLIAFSTAPGQVAADFSGEKSRNSPYTTHLLKYLKTPNLEIGQMFRRVREGVLKATGNEQIPWVTESLVGDVFLNPKDSDVAVSPPRNSLPRETLIPTLISSSTGVNYTRLRELLQAGKWEEANQDTNELMLAAAKLEYEWPNMTTEPIENFPCEDLKIIEREWINASDGKFGISVQKKLWQQAGSPTISNEGNTYDAWRQLYIDLRWQKEKDFMKLLEDDVNLIFNLIQAPYGHLPFIGDVGFIGSGWKIAGKFYLLFQHCDL